MSGSLCTHVALVLAHLPWRSTAAGACGFSGNNLPLANQMLHTVHLQAHGGVLRTTGDTYAALSQLMSCLHDPYSTFLPPSQFRQALRRPQRAERNYLEAQYVGE